ALSAERHELASRLHFFLNATATPAISPLSLHDALPILETTSAGATSKTRPPAGGKASDIATVIKATERPRTRSWLKVRNRRSVKDRKSTRLNSSHSQISYAVFCLKKKTKNQNADNTDPT